MSEQRLPVQLECGASVPDLLEQVSEGRASEPTPHQAQCSYCQLTLSRLAASWRAVERLRAERVQPSPQLLTRVMHRIRAGLDNRQVELTGELGETRISLAVLISLAFWAASAAPGVGQVFRARPRGHDLPRGRRWKDRPASLLSPDDLRIELELSIAYGFNALVVAEEVRQAVIDEIWERAGLELAGVELTIADVD